MATPHQGLRILLVKTCYSSPLFRTAFHPLGIMSLAAVCRQRGHTVRLVHRLTCKEDLGRIVQRFRPDLVGISALTQEASEMVELARDVKAVDSGIPVVAGGPHPTHFPREVLANEEIDFVVMGEGEVTFPLLLERLGDGEVEGLPGVAHRRGGEIVVGPPAEPMEDLDSLPFPAWDLIAFDEYEKHQMQSRLSPRRYGSIFSSRGCPFRCIYCHNIFGKKIRARSTQNTFAEMEMLMDRYGVVHFEFADDYFNFSRRRVHELCDLIIASGRKFTIAFANGLRGDLLDLALMEKMRAAGVIYIVFAVETASPRLQRLIRKEADLDKLAENIRISSKLGIFTQGVFMLGFPSETEEEANQTIAYACQSHLTFASFFVVKPTKGTALWEMVRDKAESAEVHLESQDYHSFHPNLSAMSDAALQRVYGRANRRFYLSPRRLLKINKMMLEGRRTPGFFKFYLDNLILLLKRLLRGG